MKEGQCTTLKNPIPTVKHFDGSLVLWGWNWYNLFQAEGIIKNEGREDFEKKNLKQSAADWGWAVALSLSTRGLIILTLVDLVFCFCVQIKIV